LAKQPMVIKEYKQRKKQEKRMMVVCFVLAGILFLLGVTLDRFFPPRWGVGFLLVMFALCSLSIGLLPVTYPTNPQHLTPFRLPRWMSKGPRKGETVIGPGDVKYTWDGKMWVKTNRSKTVIKEKEESTSQRPPDHHVQERR